jgi:rhodanese-related sulfurtransferase
MLELPVDQLLAFCRASAGAAQLLDVREAWEISLAALRVDGVPALAVPMNQLPGRLDELDASRPVVCICHHGARSAQVVAFLERQGFESVHNLVGGIDAWSLQVDPSVPRY